MSDTIPSAPLEASPPPPPPHRILGLILLWGEDADHTFLENIRTTHYPPDLLFNPAHIGLFTRLQVPPSELEHIHGTLTTICGQREPFRFKIGKLCQWGKAVVVRLNNDKLIGLRRDLNRRWQSSGIVDGQERNAYQPHITLHARVSKTAAKEHLHLISSEISRREGVLQGQVIGLKLVEYIDPSDEGRMWRDVATYRFGMQ